MGNYRYVRVNPTARPAHPLSVIFPDPTTIPIQALFGVGALLITIIALVACRDMLKPGLQAASRLHPYTPSPSSGKNASSSTHPLRRARSAASGSHSSRASSSAPTNRLTNPTYKGLRNTGNTCFFNSTLQSMSSLILYRKYLYTLVDEAERWDTPTPVIDALLVLIEELATPGDRNIAINPLQLVRALQNLPSSSIRSLVGAHQQQDAHELFALLNEAVDAEAKAIQRERANSLETEQAGLRALMAPSLPWGGRGVYADPAQAKSNLALNGSPNPLHPLALAPSSGDDTMLSDTRGSNTDNNLMISPFDALLAQRTICLDCGYCEAIRHFSASEISLSVPAYNVRTRTSEITGTSACSLQECLESWSELEQVDWICWNCTLRNTLQAVKVDIAAKGPIPASTKHNGSAAANGDANGSANSGLTPAKKKRLAQLRSKETKLARIIESGLSEDELKQASDDPTSPWHNVFNNLQLKKTLSRLSTKQIMISRPPRILALHLNRSSYSASSWAPAKNNRHVLFPEYLDLSDVTLQGSISLDGRQAMNTCTSQDGKAESVYRLSAIVVHYGSHSFGHYIAFKRVPGAYSGYDSDGDEASSSDSWLRISDESVTQATIQQVKQENPYMLFYELLPQREDQQQTKVDLPQDGADYAKLQRAIAGAMAANGETMMKKEPSDFVGSAGSGRASPIPSSLKVRPRTVHRWSTPPVS
ncbi:related to UBP1 - ubiquitin-specific protease [Ustilago trichophora]|uniref:Ubiquitin carboxyl-terminal hydrolase n=1 Tax=Ustilago trichophora TaxID=86804 RepID=A0A5C3E4Z7_9BASI|nr:related to UBP1 - ubiquitin-specific protease [Ustilago trichophora]